jgi:hypothetical protein
MLTNENNFAYGVGKTAKDQSLSSRRPPFAASNTLQHRFVPVIRSNNRPGVRGSQLAAVQVASTETLSDAWWNTPPRTAYVANRRTGPASAPAGREVKILLCHKQCSVAHLLKCISIAI